MRILGVDPGLRNTGLCLIDEKGRVLHREVVKYLPRGKRPLEEYMGAILPEFADTVGEFDLNAAGVEQVVWQGRRQMVAIPLAHMAGAMIALLLKHPKQPDVYLLTPTMKGMEKAPRQGKESDHEFDARLLAEKVRRFIIAEDAGDASALRKLSAVGQRRIITPWNAPSRLSENEKDGEE